MKKKILIGSIFAALLMLSLPVVSNIQAQSTPATIAEEDNECKICPKISDGNIDWCILLESLVDYYTDETCKEVQNNGRTLKWHIFSGLALFFMILYICLQDLQIC